MELGYPGMSLVYSIQRAPEEMAERERIAALTCPNCGQLIGWRKCEKNEAGEWQHRTCPVYQLGDDGKRVVVQGVADASDL
jgi:predicted RNA-binding Zn-ribbon protein involved in translation (DUF1610 family)